jgi:hypothetical protein
MVWNWWVLTLVPVAWLLQNCLHEFSHLVIGWIDQGLKPIGFYPWPHYYEGNFYFARCVQGEPAQLDKPHKLRWLAPFIFCIIQMILLVVLYLCIPVLRLWLIPFLVCSIVDCVWWWRGFFFGKNTCDAKRWRYGDELLKG